MNTIPYYLRVLREHFEARRKRSQLYSLRAFARDLEINQGTLSLVMNQKRELPRNLAKKMSRKLKLEPTDHTLFLESVFGKDSLIDKILIKEEDDRIFLDETYYNVIVEWEHYALLSLFEYESFDPTIEWFSAQLDISESRCLEVVGNLIASSLLKGTKDGKFEKIHAGTVRTSEDIKSQALRDGHLAALKIGAKKLFDIEIDKRDYSTLTFAVDKEQLDDVKTVIREFRQKLLSFAKEGSRNQVYQVAIQLYPMTCSKIEVGQFD